MNRNLVLVAALIATVLALAGCAKKGNPTEPGTTGSEPARECHRFLPENVRPLFGPPIMTEYPCHEVDSAVPINQVDPHSPFPGQPARKQDARWTAL